MDKKVTVVAVVMVVGILILFGTVIWKFQVSPKPEIVPQAPTEPAFPPEDEAGEKLTEPKEDTPEAITQDLEKIEISDIDSELGEIDEALSQL